MSIKILRHTLAFILISLPQVTSLFAQDTKGNENWDASFSAPGFDFVDVAQIWLAPNGDLYVSGGFNFVEDVKAKGLAKWDGEKWTRVSDSIVSNYGSSLVLLDSTLLYARGQFIAASGDTIKGIAAWDGREWKKVSLLPDLYSHVGGFHTGDINATTRQNGKWILAGDFDTSTDGTILGQIGRWEGSSWFTFRGGVQRPPSNTNGRSINALLFKGDDLYAAGSFSKIGDSLIDNMARWNENDQSWHPLGFGIQGFVNCIAEQGGKLYVGGSFSSAGGKGISNIAVWDGSDWYPVGGPKDVLIGEVKKIVFEGNTIHVLGNLKKAGKLEVHSIASWTGSSWSNKFERYDSAGNSQVSSVIGGIKDLLIVNGKYYSITQGTVWYNLELCYWQDTAWVPVHKKAFQGLNGIVNSIITVNDNEVYAGGNFRTEDGQNIHNLAMWNGSRWNKLSNDTIDGTILTMLKSTDTIFIGGSFTVKGKNIKNIAKWDGKTLEPIGNGIDTTVYGIYTINNNLYAGCPQKDQFPKYRFSVLEFDGLNWNQIGPLRVYPESYVLPTVLSEDLNGNLLTAGYGFCQIRKGNKWVDISSDSILTHSSIQSIANTDSNLYIGGIFYPNDSTISALAIVSRNGDIKYDTVFTYYYLYPVKSLVVRSDSDIYALGERYRSYNNTTTAWIKGIGHYNGKSWETLGFGLENDYTTVIAGTADEIFVGGSFWVAGDKRSSSFAIWHIHPTQNSVKEVTKIKDDISIHIYPNPVGQIATVQVISNKSEHVLLSLYDPLGRKVQDIYCGMIGDALQDFPISVGSMPSGIYFLSLQSDGENHQIKFVVNH